MDEKTVYLNVSAGEKEVKPAETGDVLTGGEEPTTAGGGNFVGSEVAVRPFSPCDRCILTREP